ILQLGMVPDDAGQTGSADGEPHQRQRPKVGILIAHKKAVDEEDAPVGVFEFCSPWVNQPIYIIPIPVSWKPNRLQISQ
ncbi:MAG: hypothetical protein Q9191_006906, partial [Dirinaria sp. TL-2023a]